MKLEEMIIHTKRGEAYKQHVKELNKELSDKRKLIKNKIYLKKTQKQLTLRSYDDLADSYLSNPEGARATANFINDLVEYINFAAKRMERYFKATTTIDVSSVVAPQLAGSMLGRVLLKTNLAYLMMVKDMIRKKVIPNIPSKVVAALEAIDQEPEAFFKKGIYPKLQNSDIEKFILTISKSPEFRIDIEKINNRLGKLGELFAKLKYMSKTKDKNTIKL